MKTTKDFQSRLYEEEQIENLDRKFGSVNRYYPLIVIDKDDEEVPALFTKNEIKIAIERAETNPEDVTKEKGKSFWEILFG